MFNFLKRLFKRTPPAPSMRINLQAETIPQGLGYPNDQFVALVDDLSEFIQIDDRLLALYNFIHSPLLEKYQLNFEDPNHAAIFGYAFCTAINSQKNKQTQEAVTKVLSTFNPPKTKTVVN